MDANFLNIRIISYRDAATFQFVPLVPQVTQVAYYTNIFATLLIYSVMYLFHNDHCRVKGINRQSHILFTSGLEKTLFSPYQGFTIPLKEAFIQDSIPIRLKSFASNFHTPNPRFYTTSMGSCPIFIRLN